MIDQITAFLSTTHELTPLSLGGLVLVFIASGFVLLPRILICVLAGVTFGAVAIPIAIPSIAFGAVIAFLTARYLAHGLVQRLIGRRTMLKRISTAVDQEGWRVVALLRLGAPIPGALTNYIFGLTNISTWSFAWATLVFCIPQIVLFVLLGAAGRQALAEDSGSLVGQAMIVLGVITSAAVILLVARRARSTLGDLREQTTGTDSS